MGGYKIKKKGAESKWFVISGALILGFSEQHVSMTRKIPYGANPYRGEILSRRTDSSRTGRARFLIK